MVKDKKLEEPEKGYQRHNSSLRTGVTTRVLATVAVPVVAVGVIGTLAALNGGCPADKPKSSESPTTAILQNDSDKKELLKRLEETNIYLENDWKSYREICGKWSKNNAKPDDKATDELLKQLSALQDASDNRPHKILTLLPSFGDKKLDIGINHVIEAVKHGGPGSISRIKNFREITAELVTSERLGEPIPFVKAMRNIGVEIPPKEFRPHETKYRAFIENLEAMQSLLKKFEQQSSQQHQPR